MRKETLMFSGSVLASVYFCGPISVVGLFIFGFAWFVYGDD